jgi:hypothetical protein
MEFLRIENVIQRIAGETPPGGRFYQLAGYFETILRDESLSASDKAARIAEALERRLDNQS